MQFAFFLNQLVVLEPRPFYLNQRSGSTLLILRAIYSENRCPLFGLRFRIPGPSTHRRMFCETAVRQMKHKALYAQMVLAG